VWSEFAERDGTLPPPDTFKWYQRLCRLYLEPLRQAFGVTIVHSGYRSRRRNLEVGGAPLSRHMPAIEPGAVAADVSCHSGTPREWYRALDRLSPGGLGLYPTHVHVDSRSKRARW
jgi:uncharacterized protein YcbK (DUF882 family)